MPKKPDSSSHATDGELAARLMRQQAGLSIKVGAVFLLLVLGLPLLNSFTPQVMQAPVLGFPLSWFILGLFFFPLAWGLSVYFVKASERLEADEARMLRTEIKGR
jgi:uncharacterized membrane protein (DUF485 family)